MNDNITSKEVAQQLGKAIQMLLDWLELKENSRLQAQPKSFDYEGYEMEILTPNEVVNELKVSKS